LLLVETRTIDSDRSGFDGFEAEEVEETLDSVRRIGGKLERIFSKLSYPVSGTAFDRGIQFECGEGFSSER